MRTTLAGILSAGILAAASKSGPEVTFYKDVLPVLQKNCQGCHRAGEAAPMAFNTYEQVRPWAKAIKSSVLAKKMPPWFADPAYGKFHNERVLSAAEIRILSEWADSGARAGQLKDAPKPVEWLEGWNIGKPDLVVEMPEAHAVAPNGTIEYTYVIVPTGLKEDTWIQAAEVRPGSRAVVHHVIGFIREPGSKWLRDYEPGKAFVPRPAKRSGNRSNNEGASESSGPGAELLVGYAPGLPPAVFQPGTAKLLKAGTDIVFQLHYTTNGKAATDQTRIGLVFSKEPPKERILTLAASNTKFVIPPGAGSHPVDSKFTLHADSRLIGLMPHMHLRGKDFIFNVVYPTGERETLLSVPKYDFNWQLWYYLKEPKLFPKGTRLECSAHFDNSANNKANPDPSKEVRWGDQSWEEMMIGWFDVAIDRTMDPAKLFKADKPAASGATTGGE